jgi:hypothetical protein
LAFCLLRVKLALTGSVKKDGDAGLLAAANEPNARKFIEELVVGVDKMLLIANDGKDGKLEYAELVANLEEVRTELEQWLKTAGEPKADGGKVGTKKNDLGSQVGRGKPKGGVRATVATD